MKLSTLCQKLFIGGKWYVGYRDIKRSSPNTYKKVDALKGQWLADPFLYEYEGKHYLFVEQYLEGKQRAAIGVYEFVDGIPVNNKIIIENNYHMSYPCVFYHKGKHYMIPESSANNTIDLYVCDSFPYNWSHKATLLSGEKYVDSTVFFDDETIYLLSYKSDKSGWKLVLFELSMDKYKMQKLCEKVYSENTGRPAGFLYHEGMLVRPSQDCRKKYGEALILNEVDVINNKSFEEHPSSFISCRDIVFPIDIQRIHTLNRDSQYEVVDLFEEKFEFFHAFRIFKRKYSL